jgi:hypothetical protein
LASPSVSASKYIKELAERENLDSKLFPNISLGGSCNISGLRVKKLGNAIFMEFTAHPRDRSGQPSLRAERSNPEVVT